MHHRSYGRSSPPPIREAPWLFPLRPDYGHGSGHDHDSTQRKVLDDETVAPTATIRWREK